MDFLKQTKTIEFPDRVVQYMKEQLTEALIDLENIDEEITTKCSSNIYCAKSNIREILEILES